MIRRCKECNNIVLGTGKIIPCEHCRKEYTEEEFEKLPQYYKIAIVGKWNGPNHFVVHLTDALKKMGHEVVNLSRYDILKEQYVYDLNECLEKKKPMSLRYVEYKHSPDFIFVEQTYQRYKNDCTFAYVIYHHREYTHMPDLVDADLLTFSYPIREDIYQLYHPYEYYCIKRKADLWCGTNMNYFKPQQKVYKGVINIGWHIEPWRFSEVNGPVARMIIGEQEKFFNEVEKSGITTFPHDTDLEVYKQILESSEAIIIDGGHFGWYTRRIFEACASKTVPIILIHSDEQLEFYTKDGLENMENCIFVNNVKELKVIDEDIRSGAIDTQYIANNAYEWVKKYDIKETAKKLIELYEGR